MINLSVEIRKEGKLKDLRDKGIIPGVLYGPKVKTVSVEVDLKKFKKVYEEAGESSLVSLKVDLPSHTSKQGSGGGKEFLVLIHETQKDSVSGEFIHVDFYQPILTEEVEATVPLVFEGEAPAVGDLGGTLVKGFQEVEVKALPQNLPHEIKVNVESLKTFEDEVTIKDLKTDEGVKIMKEPNEIVVNVVPLEKVEEELEKPIEEKVDEVGEAEEKESAQISPAGETEADKGEKESKKEEKND